MFGFKKRFAALSRPMRAVIGLVTFVFFSWMSMALSASGWVENAAYADYENNVVDYDSSFIRWNGDFGAENVSLTHLMPDGTEGPTYLADRVVFHTPGLHWLWWNSMKGRNKTMPDRFGVTLENVRDAARTDKTPGNYTNLPYDQVGCGPIDQLLTIEQLHDIGLAEVRRDVTLSLVRKDESLSTLTIDLLTHGAGQLTMDLDVGVVRPVKWRDVFLHFLTAELKSAKVRVSDRGFIALRTAACSKRAGVASAAFHAFHMKALDARLAQSGEAFDVPVRSRYGDWAEKGGDLVLQGSGLPKMKLVEFLAMDRGRKLGLGSTLSHNGGPPTPFYYQSLSAVQANVVASSAVPVAEPAANAAPAAAGVAVERAAPPPSPAPLVAAQSPPATLELTYKDLQGREGAHIEIVTSNGTVRRGTLLAHSAYLSTLKLDADAGGFNMTIPSNTVQQVSIVPPSGLPASAAAKARGVAASPRSLPGPGAGG